MKEDRVKMGQSPSSQQGQIKGRLVVGWEREEEAGKVRGLPNGGKSFGEGIQGKVRCPPQIFSGSLPATGPAQQLVLYKWAGG